MGYTYTPRGDFVLFRAVKVDKVRGIVMPESTAEAEKYIVVAVGPKVEGLQPGQEIFSLGRMGENWVRLPGSHDLVITRETNVALIVEDDGIVNEWSGQHKNYVGKAVWDYDAKLYHGEVMGTGKDVVTFQAKTIDGLPEALVDSITDYLAFCRTKLTNPKSKWDNCYNASKE